MVDSGPAGEYSLVEDLGSAVGDTNGPGFIGKDMRIWQTGLCSIVEDSLRAANGKLGPWKILAKYYNLFLYRSFECNELVKWLEYNFPLFFRIRKF